MLKSLQKRALQRQLPPPTVDRLVHTKVDRLMPTPIPIPVPVPVPTPITTPITTPIDRIDQIFYINLDKRPDRRAEIEHELRDRFQITTATRFSGVLGGLNGNLAGCTLSHVLLFRKMIAAGWETMMVFEDDCELLTSRAELEPYIEAFLADEKLDILCIGNNCGQYEKYNHLLNRCFTTQTTSCYIVKKQFVRTLLECYFPDKEQAYTMTAENTPDFCKYIGGIDTSWAPLQATHYFVMPTVRQVQQRPSFSDITHHFEQYRM
jgi:hypothetical protein